MIVKFTTTDEAEIGVNRDHVLLVKGRSEGTTIIVMNSLIAPATVETNEPLDEVIKKLNT